MALCCVIVLLNQCDVLVIFGMFQRKRDLIHGDTAFYSLKIIGRTKQKKVHFFSDQRVSRFRL